MNIEDLCLRFPHLRGMIIENLDNNSLGVCRLVNKRWMNFIDNDKMLWYRMIEKHLKNMEFDEGTKILGRMPTHIVRKIALNFQKNFSSLNFLKNRNSCLGLCCSPLIYFSLLLAAKNGNFEVYQRIMDKVEEKNPADIESYTAFHHAVENGHFELCQLIINNITGLKHLKEKQN